MTHPFAPPPAPDPGDSLAEMFRHALAGLGLPMGGLERMIDRMEDLP
jgi:hypothetical protein